MKATWTLYPVISLPISIKITPSERVLFSQLVWRVQGDSKTEFSSLLTAKTKSPQKKILHNLNYHYVLGKSYKKQNIYK